MNTFKILSFSMIAKLAANKMRFNNHKTVSSSPHGNSSSVSHALTLCWKIAPIPFIAASCFVHNFNNKKIIQSRKQN